MKKFNVLAALLAISLSAGLATQTPAATAQVASEKNMADTYQPYIEPIDVIGDFAEIPIESNKPLPKGTRISLPHHGGQPNNDGTREVANIKAKGNDDYFSDYYLFAGQEYGYLDLWAEKWSGSANDLTTQHFDLKVTLTYPDGSSEDVESSLSMTPDLRMLYKDDLKYPKAWVVDGETTTTMPIIADIPKATRVELDRDDSFREDLDVVIDPDTRALSLTPLPGFWNRLDYVTPWGIFLHVSYTDGSEDNIHIPIEPIGPDPDLHPEPIPEPQPQPEPTPNPQPQPEPKPVPKPKKNGSSFFGSSL